MKINDGLIALAFGLALIAFVVWMYARTENRRNDRWLASMQAMSRRCLDCGGVGFHFGPPGTGDPEISAPTCRTCNGAGEIVPREEH